MCVYLYIYIHNSDNSTCVHIYIYIHIQRPISWTMWTSTLSYFIETLEEADVERWHIPVRAVRTQLEVLLEPTHWGLTSQDARASSTLHELEQECRDVAVTEWMTCSGITRPFGYHRILLHLFSGRRRMGDVQYFLENMEVPESYVLHIVSMDVVVDGIWGDAMATGTRNYWLKAAKDGYIAAFLAGPPCETWSKARGREVGSRRGPRIVRDESHLWGLPMHGLERGGASDHRQRAAHIHAFDGRLCCVHWWLRSGWTPSWTGWTTSSFYLEATGHACPSASTRGAAASTQSRIIWRTDSQTDRAVDHQHAGSSSISQQMENSPRTPQGSSHWTHWGGIFPHSTPKGVSTRLVRSTGGSFPRSAGLAGREGHGNATRGRHCQVEVYDRDWVQ